MGELIIDIGSLYAKYGISSSDSPDRVINSVIGKPKKKCINKFTDILSFVGNEIGAVRSDLNLLKVVEHGHVCSLELLDLLISYMFDEFSDSSNGSILYCIPPRLNHSIISHLGEVFFDVYSYSFVSFNIQGLLSLYATGQTSGVIYEVGDGVSQILPVYQGQVLNNSILRFDLGGADITTYLQLLFAKNGYKFLTTNELDMVRKIKEDLCFLSVDIENECRSESLTRNYILPDGASLKDETTEINISLERVIAGEVLFDPSLIGLDTPSCTEMIKNSISNSPLDLRADLYNSIIVTGGTSKLSGFIERLQDKIIDSLEHNRSDLVNVKLHPHPDDSAWVGGKIFCQFRETDQKSWITFEQYQELGETFISRFPLLR